MIPCTAADNLDWRIAHIRSLRSGLIRRKCLAKAWYILRGVHRGGYYNGSHVAYFNREGDSQASVSPS
jgi:hypothetical protein